MSDIIDDVREGLAAALRTIPGVQAAAHFLSDMTPPCAMVLRGDFAYDQSMGGGIHQIDMKILAQVANASDIGASKLLGRFLAPDGERSIKAAIEADTTLGGVVSDVHVTSASGEQVYERKGGPLLGSELTVEVWL